MCRLFGMTTGDVRGTATFWLLEAPDSLEEQSRRNPDGTGLGAFKADGTPEVFKQPIAAFEDAAFVREARHVESATFVAHVRFATNGATAKKNTHPFQQDGRLFAHNGVIGEVPGLEKHLGADMDLVAGDTDSERYFALITRETLAHGGDVAAGIAAAAGWIAHNLPVWSINFVLVTPADLWAFRYPETRKLYVLERAGGGPAGGRAGEFKATETTTRVRAAHLADTPAVVVASEPLDDAPGWRLLDSGELIHVGADLAVESTTAVDHAPARRLTLPGEAGAKPAG